MLFHKPLVYLLSISSLFLIAPLGDRFFSTSLYTVILKGVPNCSLSTSSSFTYHVLIFPNDRDLGYYIELMVVNERPYAGISSAHLRADPSEALFKLYDNNKRVSIDCTLSPTTARLTRQLEENQYYANTSIFRFIESQSLTVLADDELSEPEIITEVSCLNYRIFRKDKSLGKVETEVVSDSSRGLKFTVACQIVKLSPGHDCFGNVIIPEKIEIVVDKAGSYFSLNDLSSQCEICLGLGHNAQEEGVAAEEELKNSPTAPGGFVGKNEYVDVSSNHIYKKMGPLHPNTLQTLDVERLPRREVPERKILPNAWSGVSETVDVCQRGDFESSFESENSPSVYYSPAGLDYPLLPTQTSFEAGDLFETKKGCLNRKLGGVMTTAFLLCGAILILVFLKHWI